MSNYQQLIDNGDYQKVVKELTNIMAFDNYNTEALGWLAKAQFKLEQYNEAIDNYSKLINLLPSVADLYSNRGLCYHLAGEAKAALKDFDMAVDLEPENGYRYSCRAFVKDYYKDYKGALADYNKAIEIDPEDAITHNNKGVLEEKLGFAEQAQQSFTTSNKIQGIDLGKELAKINVSDSPPITLPKIEPEKLSMSSYISVVKTIFSTKKGLKEFVGFLTGKKK